MSRLRSKEKATDVLSKVQLPMPKLSWPFPINERNQRTLDKEKTNAKDRYSYDRTSQPLRDGRNMVWNQNKEVSRGARSARQPNSVWKEMVKHIPTNGDRKKYHAE
ncbi:hypothetical protein Bca101_072249 [Brassica carinata]